MKTMQIAPRFHRFIVLSFYRFYTRPAIFIIGLVTPIASWRMPHGECLMDNHYHLLIETPKAKLSRGMRQLNGVYTQTVN
jgi:hypothetical protein